MCNGHGECKCGKCYCSDGYYGEFCQDCEVSENSFYKLSLTLISDMRRAMFCVTTLY